MTARVTHRHGLGLGLTAASVRARLQEELRAQGIQDSRVLEVMGRIPRHEFVEEALKGEAYRNRSLPIGQQQTISQPFVVALMTQAILGPDRPRRVLEVGTGSGYQTAVLAELVEVVFTLERLRALSEAARLRLERLGYRNVHFGYADGMQGWAPYQPFDAIVVTAGHEQIPAALIHQLAPGGRLVIPVGPQGSQVLTLMTREADGLRRKLLADVSFVPLLPGKA